MMNSKLLKICLAACLAVSFVGCNDDDKNSGESCDPATDSNVLGSEYGMACVDNKWIVTQCGDGKLEGAEQCEGTDVGDATCAKRIGEGALGKVTCNKCRLDYADCSLPPTPGDGRVEGECGDGVLNSGEDCDGENLDNQTCGSLIKDGKGDLACTSACKFDFSGCSVDPIEEPPVVEEKCGNGELDDEELCDIDADGKVIVRGNVTCADALHDESAIGDLGCTDKCVLDVDGCSIPVIETCGNGELDGDEDCDVDEDGNIMFQDGLSCASELDDESATGDLKCTNDCKIDSSECEIPGPVNTCGNGELDEGEFCDGELFIEDADLSVECEGGIQTSHPCKDDCSGIDADKACELIPENCANGVLDDGEACDVDEDGNVLLPEGVACADMLEGSEGELGCTALCKIDSSNCAVHVPECGDGILDEGEACDGESYDRELINFDVECPEGYAQTSSPCNAECSGIDAAAACEEIPEGCGDGVLGEDEACDVDEEGNVLVHEDVTCASMMEDEMYVGSLSCSPVCKIETYSCIYEFHGCGDGILDEGEICDGDQYSDDLDLTVVCDEGFAQTSSPCNAECSGIDAAAACEMIPEGCGDGVLGEEELCDIDGDGNVLVHEDVTCASILENEEATGELSCNAVCNIVTTACEVPSHLCGNGVLDEGELCDGEQFADDLTCATALENVLAVGELSCTSECELDTSACEIEEHVWCETDAECGEDMFCNHGVCLTEEMYNIEEGADCDPASFVEFCKDDTIVSCTQKYDEGGNPIVLNDDYVYNVAFSDCGENGGCGMFNMQRYAFDNPNLIAWCNGANAGQCEDENTRITFCDDGEAGSAYASYYFCQRNSDGEFGALNAFFFREIYAFCEDEGETPATCNDDHTQCKIPATLWCDVDAECRDGNHLYTCEEDPWGGVHEWTYTCDEDFAGSVCTTVSDRDGCYVPCENLGEVISQCEQEDENSLAYAVEKICRIGEDSNYYYAEKRDPCYNGCTEREDSGAVCNHVSSSEGEACDVFSYGVRCDGDAMLHCDYQTGQGGAKVSAMLCDYEGESCAKNEEEGFATCLEPCDPAVDETKSVCYEGYASANSYGLSCVEYSNGYFWDYNDDEEECVSNLCLEDHTACAPAEVEEP